MVADKGRDLLLRIEDSPGSGTYTTIASLTGLTLNITNSTVDITNKSSDGWQTLL